MDVFTQDFISAVLSGEQFNGTTVITKADMDFYLAVVDAFGNGQ